MKQKQNKGAFSRFMASIKQTVADTKTKTGHAYRRVCIDEAADRFYKLTGSREGAVNTATLLFDECKLKQASFFEAVSKQAQVYVLAEMQKAAVLNNVKAFSSKDFSAYERTADQRPDCKIACSIVKKLSPKQVGLPIDETEPVFRHFFALSESPEHKDIVLRIVLADKDGNMLLRREFTQVRRAKDKNAQYVFVDAPAQAAGFGYRTSIAKPYQFERVPDKIEDLSQL